MSVNRWTKRLLVAVPVLIALFFGGLLIYVNVIRSDPAPELTSGDLTERVDAADATIETATAAAATASAATATSTATSTVASSAARDDVAGFDGTWAVTDESEFGYRVEEVLFGVNATATGRSNEIAGSMTLDATTVTEATFTVDVASITSDEARRDGQFRGRIMDTERFPEATFTLTEPIAIGTIPADGEQVTATATGDLTLHGVTRPTTFDVTAEAGDGRIGVLGNIPIVFADYEIANPSVAGITTEDDGLLEFILVFEPA